jgi:phosphate transport system substrate-binding protein
MKAALSALLLAIALGAPLNQSDLWSFPASLLCSQLQPSTSDRTSPWEDLAIVVNRSNAVSDVTLWQLRDIFLGEKKWWSCKRRVVPVAMARGAEERQVMQRVVYGMNDADLDKYFFFKFYGGELMTSRATAASAKDVRTFVANKPGAIGYVRMSDLDNSLKVVRVNGLLPGDDGYPLRVAKRIP